MSHLMTRLNAISPYFGSGMKAPAAAEPEMLSQKIQTLLCSYAHKSASTFSLAFHNPADIKLQQFWYVSHMANQ